MADPAATKGKPGRTKGLLPGVSFQAARPALAGQQLIVYGAGRVASDAIASSSSDFVKVGLWMPWLASFSTSL